MAVTFLTNEDEKRILDEANAGKLLIAPQELTEEEKEQARNNIGAVSADEHTSLIEIVQTTAQDLDRVSEVVEETLGSRLANGSVTLIDREGSEETLFLDHDKLHMTVRDKVEVVLTAGYQELTSEQMDAARYNIDAASVEDVTKRTEYDGFVDEDITGTLTIEDGCFYGKNLTKLEQKGLACTSLIPVKSGDKFKISSVYGYYSPLVAEFDSTKTMVSYTAQIDGTDVPVTDYEYTVPSGVSYIAINSRYQQTKPLVVKKVVVDSVKHRIAKLEKGGTGGGTGEIPETLPNPHPLRFTGAVSAEYDGSEAVEVNIPAGGGGSREWRLLKILALTEEVRAIKIDTDTSGQPFAVKEVCFSMKGTAGHDEDGNGYTDHQDYYAYPNATNAGAIRFKVSSGLYKTGSFVSSGGEIEVLTDRYVRESAYCNGSVCYTGCSSSVSVVNAITELNLYATVPFGIGCNVVVWGR